ncbi:MAG: glycosyltransferase family 4 protein [Gemmatimonadaceae bacterium]|nr:glycosyltransferase family 4 protein [Gemmatimonadaceae bacterium]
MMPDTAPLKVVVIASSFPAINQPWINTHFSQLEEQGVDFRIVHSTRADSEERKQAAGSFLPKCTYISRDPRDWLRSFLAILTRHPLRELLAMGSTFSRTAAYRLPLRDRLKIMLMTLHLRHVLGTRPVADVVHIHFDQDVLGFGPWVAASGTPLLTTFHGLNPFGVPKLSRAVRAATFQLVDMVFANTTFAAGQAAELGCPPEKIRIVPQGLPLDKFPFSPAPVPSQDDPVRILSVGRLQRDKGQVHALLAAVRLVRIGVRLRWDFVGSGPDLSRLRRLVERFQLQDSIGIHQGVSPEAMRNFYESAHIFVLASTTNSHGYHIETQGVVLQEAQATGCLVVASRVGGIPECVNDEVDAVLVEESSSRAIADGISRLLANKHRWGEWRNAARRNVERQFNSSSIGRRMVESYRDAVRNRRAVVP